ncbi:sugar ABC transporter ATP-binding protein [Hydrogenispora ethanolica]|nr:sugar ABC transporter ATP-binding protein [Hydrogenispora ethanolica]
MSHINISFPGVKALTNVDFTVSSGEIHALMGQNGAGKSTLIKVLTGVHRRESGKVLFEGKEIDPHSPHEAQLLGISTVYQEVNLVPYLSVAENIYLGRQPMRFGQIDWKEINRRAESALARLNIQLDVTEPLSAYSIAIQQMVAIARAVDISARLLILDEPTSSLDENEVKQLFEIMRKLKNEGMGIIFITHFLNQVYEISDRITVLRNGNLVGSYETAKFPRLELITAMVGKELADLEKASSTKTARHQNVEEKEAFLKVNGIGRKGSIHPLDLVFSLGEVVGLAGLLGSGRTELAKLIFGIDRSDKGQALLDGKPVSLDSPQRAISCGFGYCPEDRKREGIISNLTVRENIILALQTRQGWFRFLSRKKQLEIVEKFIRDLNIITPSTEQPVKNLSGGNQQKVILARWLASNPRFLILDEPTRGIDVEAKTEIQKLIMELCNEGMSILFISSELEEVVRCSHRVTVLRDRVKIAELLGENINEEKIIHTIAEGGLKH